jgi:hypothetical protein
MGDLDSSVSDDAAPDESTFQRNIRLGMDPTLTYNNHSSININNHSNSNSSNHNNYHRRHSSDDTDTVLASNVETLRNNNHNHSNNNHSNNKQTNNGRSGAPASTPITATADNSNTMLLFQQIQKSLDRQEERMEHLFHLTADTNFKLDLMMRRTDALSGQVRVLDEKVEQMHYLQTVPVPNRSVSATGASAAATTLSSTASSQQQQISSSSSRPNKNLQPKQTSEATCTDNKGEGDKQVSKQPTVVAQQQQPTVPVPRPANNNKSRSSKNNNTNKSTKSVEGGTVTEHSSGGEKRLPPKPGEVESPTSRTASTVMETSNSSCNGVGDDDDDDVNDAVSLWEDEEREVVEIQLPVCVSSLPSGSALLSASSSTNDSIIALRQYGSADDRWGIYSTIWDGGLALTAYLASHYFSYYTDAETGTDTGTDTIINNNNNNSSRGSGGVILIDLGSGTGLVGLAVAALSRGRAAVAVTDLAQALPLLEENVRLNSKLWTTTAANGTSVETDTNRPVIHIPVVHELTWGEPIADAWLEQLIAAMPHTAAPATSTPTTTPPMAQSQSHSRILLTGADIIYRPSLFQPLLATLSELSARLHQLAPDAMVECLLACQSRFTYLQDFWDAARRQNFAVDILAVVRLDSVQKTDLSQAKIEYVGGNSGGGGNPLGSKKMTVAPSPNSSHEDDRVYIVRIHKLPYTFSI